MYLHPRFCLKRILNHTKLRRKLQKLNREIGLPRIKLCDSVISKLFVSTKFGDFRKKLQILTTARFNTF